MKGMSDTERKRLPVRAVAVAEGEFGSEYYEVGKAGITGITWAETCGHMAPLMVVQVWREGRLNSEHNFANVLGVYYAEPSHD